MAKKTDSQHPHDLLVRANTNLTGTKAHSIPPAQSSERQLHEPRGQPSKLEMQNEEMRHLLRALETSRDHYARLYDFTPVGYLTLSAEGVIEEANLTAASLLGVDRQKLVKRLFTEFVAPEDSDFWQHYFERLKQEGGKQHHPLNLKREGDTVFYAHLDCLGLKNDNVPARFHISFCDINYLKTCQTGDMQRFQFQDPTTPSARKSQEQTSRNNEAFLHAVLDSVAADIAVLDQDGVIVAINDSWWRFALEHSTDSTQPQLPIAVGANYLNVCLIGTGYSEESVMEACTGIHAVLDGRLPTFNLEYACKQHWFSMSVTPLNTDFGGAVLTYIDITERKQAELALRANDEAYHSILRTTLDGFWVISPQGVLLDVNTRYAQQSGYSRDELLGMSVTDLEADGDVTTTHLQRIMEQGGDQFESVHRRKDGSTWHVEVSVTYLDFNDGLFFAFFRDITARKAAEAELQVAAAAFETQAGIVVTDAKKRILRVNKAFSRITGNDGKDIIGQSPSFLKSGLHDEAFYKSMKTSIKEQGYWQGEIWDKRQNGDVFPLWLTISAVTNKDGLITHYVSSFTDITAQKQAEKILLDARLRLENQVATTQEELEKIKQDSVAVNTALGVLLKHQKTDSDDAQCALSLEVENTVLPFLKRLKAQSMDKKQTRLLDVLEINLRHLVKSYGRPTSLPSAYQHLTPVEIQVASMVRQGLATKTIAATLNLAPGTVDIHRKHIRKKLGLDGKSANLSSYLLSLSE